MRANILRIRLRLAHRSKRPLCDIQIRPHCLIHSLFESERTCLDRRCLKGNHSPLEPLNMMSLPRLTDVEGVSDNEDTYLHFLALRAFLGPFLNVHYNSRESTADKTL